ncbi:MAG: M23 family metallopeptidase [Bacteroidetes bacterium]|nr:M23 family metallopeptidase [Bacteroidota bacterium]
MAKAKYYFNPNTLKYEKVIIGLRKKMFRVIGFIASAMVFATFIVYLAYNFFDSPKEKQLKREIEKLTDQYDQLSNRIKISERVLLDLESRDDNIYRVIFESEPVPRSMRMAGFGGVNRYKELQGFDNADLMSNVSKQMDILEKKIYVQSKSFDEVFERAKNKTSMLAHIPGIQPVKNDGRSLLVSGFGYRIHPIYKTSMMHTGIDFSAPMGTAIYATGDGVVEQVLFDGRGYGNHVIINHGFGYTTLYGHMSKILVRRGQKIKRGDKIGLVGSTGASTAPHCHYEVIKDGKKIDPVNFFYNDLTPEQYQLVIELARLENQSFD